MRTKSVPAKTKPPADFEEVKRRFIRQNRELAKNNSGQSLRIRSLELEVSRLLADNLELRNQVLHLQNEVYTARKKASNSAALRVKTEMRAKIAALSKMVDAIEDADSVSPPARERKPVEGNWRERQTLTELMRDTAMPTVSEGKSYPRRTLGADDIQPIRLSDQSSNESPDLGPPPVAHFDYEDPVKAASPLNGKVSSPKAENERDEEIPATLAVNIEARRKRKDGQSRLETRRSSLLGELSAKPEGEQSSILRTGAKRKLADRENEKPIKPPSKGDFTFSRKANGEQAKGTENDKPSTEDSSDKIVVAPRKALSDKSVNMSTRKSISSKTKLDKDSAEKPAASKLSASKDTSTTRRRRTSSIPIPSPPRQSVQTAEIPPPHPATSIEHDPATPAALDLFSPATSEPSARLEGGREGTPPPADLSSLSMTTDGGRQSRRARSAVNYAEPSLIAKMRRPDKKMVDALTGLQDHRRAMSASGDLKSSAGPLSTVKKEPQDSQEGEERWKDLPPARNVEASSPLLKKASTEALNQKFENDAPLPAENDPPPSTSSATISALMASSRRRRQSIQDVPLGTDIDVDAAAKKMEEMDLYEFKESSSPMTDSSGAGEVKGGKASVRTHRRHSSVPKEARLELDGVLASSGSTVDLKRASGERLASRRRSMML